MQVNMLNPATMLRPTLPLLRLRAPSRQVRLRNQAAQQQPAPVQAVKRAPPRAAPSTAVAAKPQPQVNDTQKPAPEPAALHTPSGATIPDFVNGCLTSHFIDTSLYHPEYGYFNRNKERIISPSAIDWSTIRTQSQYIKLLDTLYSSAAQSWLTPVELYQPYFGQAIARWVVQTYLQDSKLAIDSLHTSANTATPSLPPLHIIEIGGGNGTLANNVLDYIAEHHSALYDGCQYTIYDLSAMLHQNQHSACAKRIQAGKLQLINRSAVDIQASDNSDNTVNVILGMEVLDNMSHDKVVRINSQLLQTHIWHLTQPHTVYRELTANHVLAARNSAYGSSAPTLSSYYETYAPLNNQAIVDYLSLSSDYNATEMQRRNKSTTQLPSFDLKVGLMISRLGPTIARFAMSYGSGVESTFVPTTALKFLQRITEQLPNHHLLLGDFNHLPNAIQGINAPVVASKHNKRDGDLDTYLCELGSADIFFPTDFYKLQHIYEKLRQQHSQSYRAPTTVYSNYEFMRQYAPSDSINIKSSYGWSSYKPMEQDYINVQFLSA